MTNQKSSSKLGLGVVIGAVTGVVAGLVLAPKSGKKLRSDVAKRAREIRKKMEENNVDEVVQNIFDDVSDKTIAIYNTAKDMISEKLAEVTEPISKIDKNKYSKVVSDVVNVVRKDKGVAEETLVKLKKYLEDDYAKLNSPAAVSKKPKKTVKKTSAKKH